MKKHSISFSLTNEELLSLEILFERIRDLYPHTDMFVGPASGIQTHHLDDLTVFEDEFKVVEYIDNILRKRLYLKSY